MENYRKTLYASFSSYIVQAICIDYAPLLFVQFSRQFSLPLSSLTAIVSVTFLVQLVMDAVSSSFIDRIGYKKAILLANALAFTGLALLSFLPLMISPFFGIMISVFFYALGSGLVEVMVSPMVEALPLENKAGVMNILHAFYSVGQLVVVLFSSLFFFIFSTELWSILTLIFALVPLVNFIVLITCPVRKLDEEEEEKESMLSYFRNPVFYLFILMMISSGASEHAVNQWASYFAETVLHLNKEAGDILAPAFFALMMAFSRLIFTKKDMDAEKILIKMSILCLVCYLVIALSDIVFFSLLAIGFTGFAVGLFWPLTFTLSRRRLKGRTMMFALLALFGDIGCTLGPSFSGLLSSSTGSMRSALLFSSVFPLMMLLPVVILTLKRKKECKSQKAS